MIGKINGMLSIACPWTMTSLIQTTFMCNEIRGTECKYILMPKEHTSPCILDFFFFFQQAWPELACDVMGATARSLKHSSMYQVGTCAPGKGGLLATYIGVHIMG